MIQLVYLYLKTTKSYVYRPSQSKQFCEKALETDFAYNHTEESVLEHQSKIESSSAHVFSTYQNAPENM